MSLALCPHCGQETTVDGDNAGAAAAVFFIRVVLLGGIAFFLGSLLHIALGVALLALSVLNTIFKLTQVLATGATTCHGCGTRFTTR